MLQITYSRDNTQVFITNIGKYYRSGTSILLSEITEKDILELLERKREQG